MDQAENNARISERIRRIYEITAELEELYPGRHFTPDGHMVGSIGEVLVAENYGLQLLPASSETHDAIAPDGRYVQIKATQIKRISISSEPDYLIVIKLYPDGSFKECYNGRGRDVWNAAGLIQKNGQRSISLAKLSKLNDNQEETDRIQRKYVEGQI